MHGLNIDLYRQAWCKASFTFSHKNILSDRYLLLLCNSIIEHRLSMKWNCDPRRSPGKRVSCAFHLCLARLGTLRNIRSENAHPYSAFKLCVLSLLSQGFLAKPNSREDHSIAGGMGNLTYHFLGSMMLESEVFLDDWKRLDTDRLGGCRAKNARYHFRWRLAPLFLMRGHPKRRRQNVLDLSR